MIEMTTHCLGLRFKNPVLPASGPNGRNARVLRACAEGGAGGLLNKTISVQAAKPPAPNIARCFEEGLINSELWSELPPARWFEKELPEAIAAAREQGLPFIASIGYSADEVRQLGPQAEAAGVDAIEFTLHYVERDFASAVRVARTLRESVEIPIIAKLSPHFGDLGELAAQLEPYVDAFACINSLGPALRIDIERVKPMLASQWGFGWLSGEPIRPIALRSVFEVARRVARPVIGIGGVRQGVDLIEFLMAGASLVGVCTAALIHGNTIYGRIAEEAATWLDEHGYSSPDNVRGLYLKRMTEQQG